MDPENEIYLRLSPFNLIPFRGIAYHVLRLKFTVNKRTNHKKSSILSLTICYFSLDTFDTAEKVIS
jgi:hypothetical protein